MTTPILGLTELIASQSQPHIPINTATRALEAVAQISVISIENDPPLSPADGDCYLVGDTPTGDFVGYEDYLAVLIGGGWEFFAPVDGWIAYVQDANTFYFWDAGPAAWTTLLARGIPHFAITGDETISEEHNGGKLVVGGVSPAVTITVPLYDSLQLSLDFAVTVVNVGAADVTISMETGSPQDVMYLSNTGDTGARTLGQYGICTLTKVSETEWIITGVGLS